MWGTHVCVGVWGSCLERWDSDAVGDDQRIGGGSGFAYGDGYGLADTGDLAGKHVSKAIGETTAERAGGAGVDGVDQNGDRRDETREAREETCVGKVGVKDVGALAPMPGEVEEPALGIDPGFAHLEREVSDVGLLQPGCKDAGRSCVAG